VIELLFMRVGERVPESAWDALLLGVPRAIREDVNRYRRWEDRQSRLFGKLLLREWLVSRGEGRDCLQRLGKGPFGRPVLEGIEFSISHSEEYTVLCTTDRGRIGIDIEKLRPVPWNEFSVCMTPDERQTIALSNDSGKAFFRFWTKKECVLKADGRGLLLPMQEAVLQKNQAILEGRRWCLQEIAIDRGSVCHLASSFKAGPIKVRELAIPDFLQPMN
jgi:4'-phosphopantetheinyl transferase